MNKKLQCLLMLIIFLLSIFLMINKINANELIGMMKVYKLKINLINVDTDAYTIELIDGISNRIYDTQVGNKKGQHDFTIATDMDENHLEYYGIKVRFNNGDVKSYDSIEVDKLKMIDNDNTDSSYNYEYNVLINLLPKSIINTIYIILAIVCATIMVIYLIKHKKRII